MKQIISSFLKWPRSRRLLSFFPVRAGLAWHYGRTYGTRGFSQTGEDVIIDFIFKRLKIEKPSYLDIGAHHPFMLSNTCLMSKNGSRGINVEPNPDLHALFQIFRPRDINLNVGIAPVSREMDFYLLTTPTLSTFSKKEALKVVAEDPGQKIEKTMRIPAMTLTDILDQYVDGTFPHFLNIDAEGMNEVIIADVLARERDMPVLICVETLAYAKTGTAEKDTSIIKDLVDAGYLLFADTYINSILVNRKLWEGRDRQ